MLVMLRQVCLWSSIAASSVLLDELSNAQLRQLLDATNKVSADELSLATPPPTQIYGQYDPEVPPPPDFASVRNLIAEELQHVNQEVSTKVLDILHALSKVSTQETPEPDNTDAHSRRLGALDLTSAYPSWTASPWPQFTGTQYTTTPQMNPYGMYDPWMPYGYYNNPYVATPYTYTPYYSPPMVPGMNLLPTSRSVATSPQASESILKMMLTQKAVDPQATIQSNGFGGYPISGSGYSEPLTGFSGDNTPALTQLPVPLTTNHSEVVKSAPPRGLSELSDLLSVLMGNNSNNETILSDLLGALGSVELPTVAPLDIPSLAPVEIPTVAPLVLEEVTAQSVANIWNNMVDSLTNTTSNLSLPGLDNYNASLPELSTIGNLAGLSDIGELVGSNLGSSLGSSVGNLASGTTSLFNNYISGAQEAFLDAFSPQLASLMGSSASGSRRMLSNVAHRRRLDTSKPTCAIENTLYRSADSMNFNNVDSLTVCQMICQTYSDAGKYFAGCASTQQQCIGVSFSEVTGRCSIFYTIEDQFTIEGYSSAPLHCDGSSFVQTESRVASIAANTACSSSLDWNVIRTVADSASPAVPDVLSVSSFPELPAFENSEVSNTNIWRYNPDTPMNQDHFQDNVIYQIGYGVSATDGYWGQSTNITDWRYCAWLCTQQDLCTHWTYFFNAQTYATQKGGCTLATNIEPSATAVSAVQTISGPRMTELPVDLFGAYGNSGRRLYVADPVQKKWVPHADPPKRRLDSPYLSTIVDRQLMAKYGLRQLEAEDTGVISTSQGESTTCEEGGFAYRSLYSTGAVGERMSDTVASYVARTPEACATSCQDAAGCIAWQYLPEYTISSDTRLQESQITTCALLSSVANKVPSVPQMISGLSVAAGGCSSDQLPKMLGTVSSVPLNGESTLGGGTTSSVITHSPMSTEEISDTKTSEVNTTSSNSTHTCVDENGHENEFANGVSVRGQLLSGGSNVVREIENPEECRLECEAALNCTMFSWGRWQGCYLMETVEAFVSDTKDLVYSGYKDCKDNARNSDSSRRRLDDAVDDTRSVVTCERATRGLIYSEGKILSQLENQYMDADACWNGCRTHPDCFYMSYITADDKNVCVFFSEVDGSTEVASSVAMSAENHCDALGDIDFELNWWEEVTKKAKSKVGATVGGVMGGAIGLSAVILVLRYRMKKNSSSTGGAMTNRTTFLADLTPSVDESGRSNGVTSEGKSSRKRNMFGMASPSNLERGSPTIHIDDFEKVEPKSTGKRLRRYF